MTKKSHVLYAIISLCAIIAYCGFLVKNSITDVNSVEETLPHISKEQKPTEKIVSPPVYEASLVKVDVKLEEATESVTSPVVELPTLPPVTKGEFSPVFPAQGTVTGAFSSRLTYNAASGDWRSHGGIDITPEGDLSVFAIEDGYIRKAYSDPTWGMVIEIDHGEYISYYKSLDSLAHVTEGDSVKRGDFIASAGTSCPMEGNDAHLHFEIRHFGELIDPTELLD